MRPVAAYSIKSGTAKKRRLLPRSFSKTRRPKEAAQTSATGPKYLRAGIWTPRMVRLVAARRARVSARYPAKKIMSAMRANSEGWKPTGPRLTQRRGAVSSLAQGGRGGGGRRAGAGGGG